MVIRLDGTIIGNRNYTSGRTGTKRSYDVPVKNTNNAQTDGKVLAGVGLLTLGAISILLGRSKGVKTAIEKAQKVFKNTFMRENITTEETVQMIKRYKEIEKIPDKKDYVQALFNEAKKNYGFEKGTLHCKFVNNPKDSVGGKNYSTQNFIEINIAHDRKKMLEYVHHELRHAKQDYCAFNFDSEAAVRARMENDYHSVLNGTAQMSEFLRPIYAKYKDFDEFYNAMIPVKENILKTVKEKFGLKEFSRDLIPKSQYEYAKKCIEASRTTVDSKMNYTDYYNNFLEGGDAYPAGINISKAIRSAMSEVE